MNIVTSYKHSFKLRILYINCRKNGLFSTKPGSSVPKPYEAIPGLSTLPIIGALHHFLPVIGILGPNANLKEIAKLLYEKYGTVVKLEGILSRANMVFLFEPKDYEQVYRSENNVSLRPGLETMEYYQAKWNKSVYKELRGLTNAQGLQWKDFRSKVNPAFLKLKLVKSYAPVIDEIAQEMVNRLVRLKDDVNYLQYNFYLEMSKLALESIGVIGLGTRLGCFQDYLSPDSTAMQLIKYSKTILDLACEMELGFGIWKYISTPSFMQMMHAFDLQLDLSKKIIDEAKIKIKNRGYEVPEEEKTIIEKLLAIDDKVALLMSNEILFGGIDTVAHTLTGLLYNLAINQRVQDKLRDEIRAPAKDKKYLKACLKESMRLYPVLQANLRRTSKEHIVSNYIIPKGVDVVAPHEFISTLEKHYPHPTVFIPERWISDKDDPLYYGNAHPMVSLPFGFGTRMCIGRRIAELEIETFLIRLLTELKITWAGPPAKLVNKIFNSFTSPYYFKFELVK